MKNLHYLKKFVVMVLAAMMTLSTFALPTLAKTDDNTTATIKGVEYNANVTGYQFVEQDSATSKWKPSKWVGATPLTGNDADKGFTFEHGGETFTLMYDGSGNYAAALDALAYKAKTYNGTETINTVNFTTTATSGTGDFTATLNKRGSYVVTAYSNNTATGETGITVYKPMVVSRAVAVDEDGDLYENAGTVNNVAEAKSSNTAFDKVIKEKADSENNTAAGGNSNVTQGENSNKGDTLKPGDETVFQIKATAPAYSEDYFVAQEGYTGPTVKITDTLDKLTLVKDQKYVVKFEGQTLEEGKYTLTPAADGKSFVFVVTDKATLKAGGDYVIEYKATLDDDANTGFIANTNTAKYEYTRKPGVDTNGKPFNNDEEEKTYHYTFDIDGSINGGEEGREIIKVGIDNYTGDIITSENNWSTAQSPLEGATFVLVKRGTDEVVCAAVSDENGLLKASDQKVKYKGTDYVAKGLTKIDAGEYDLIEVTAPDPYRPYTNPIPVSIKAKLYEADGDNDIKKGMLEWYSVQVNNEDTNEYTFNAGNKKWDTVYKYTDKDGKLQTTTSQAEFSGATNIVNTQVSTLPSTGGMGTVLFTVGGIAIMGIALFLLFGGKKKQHQK